MNFNHLNSARHPRESFKNFRARRQAVNKAVKVVQTGKWAHISSKPLVLPELGKDPQIDRAILAGEIRDVVPMTKKDGTQFRVGRTKGETYRHWTKKHFPNMKRAERRQLFLDRWSKAPQ